MKIYESSSSGSLSVDKHGDGKGLARGLLEGFFVKSKDMCRGKPTLFVYDGDTFFGL